MKVIMKVDVSGTRNGERWPLRGETVDLPTDEAAALVAAGITEAIDGQKVEKRPAPTAKVEKRA